MSDRVSRAVISGLGLMGGSLGMALRQAGWRVGFVDPHVSLEEAVASGAADEKLDGLDGAPVELIVLATPVDVAVESLAAMAIGSAVVTSVCSVMLPLVEVAGRRGLGFVAGHPLAGSERSGLAAATADLFRGRRWFTSNVNPVVSRMIESTGAQEMRVDPREHDETIALTSHAPQVLSTALASVMASAGDAAATFAGPGLATFLRLAGSDYSVWRPILQANREQIIRALEQVNAEVHRIIDGDGEAPFGAANEIVKTLRKS